MSDTFLRARSYSDLTDAKTVAQMLLTLPNFPQQMNGGDTVHIQLRPSPQPSWHTAAVYMQRDPWPGSTRVPGACWNCRISGLNPGLWNQHFNKIPRCFLSMSWRSTARIHCYRQKNISTTGTAASAPVVLNLTQYHDSWTQIRWCLHNAKYHVNPV